MTVAAPPPITGTPTHRVMRTWLEREGPENAWEVHVHRSRTCDNCAHDGVQDREWVAEGAMAEFGRCKNSIGAADAADITHHWCDNHQTRAEFDAYVHRPERPVLAVVAGRAP